MLFPSEIPPSFLFSKIKTGNPIDKNENQIFARRSCDVAVTSRSIKTNTMWNLSWVLTQHPVFKMGKKDAHIFVLLHNVFIWRLHTSRPDGNVTSVAPKLFLCLFKFSRKKSTMRWKGLSDDQDPTPDCTCILVCLFSFWSVWRLFFLFPKKKENKKQKAIVRHMVGWEKMYR